MTGSNRRHSACKADALPTELITPLITAVQFRWSLSALPGRNLGTLAALILIEVPVRGLRPSRAARLPTANVPKPTSDTESPFFRVVLTASMVASSARDAAALEMSALEEMKSISSVLFTKNLSWGVKNQLLAMRQHARNGSCCIDKGPKKSQPDFTTHPKTTGHSMSICRTTISPRAIF